MVWPFTLLDYFTGLFSKQFQNLIHQMRNENTHEYEQEFFYYVPWHKNQTLSTYFKGMLW